MEGKKETYNSQSEKGSRALTLKLDVESWRKKLGWILTFWSLNFFASFHWLSVWTVNRLQVSCQLYNLPHLEFNFKPFPGHQTTSRGKQQVTATTFLASSDFTGFFFFRTTPSLLPLHPILSNAFQDLRWMLLPFRLHLILLSDRIVNFDWSWSSVLSTG